MSVVDELFISLSVCAPAKYGEASAKASYDQPYVHMIKYFITNAIFLKESQRPRYYPAS